MCNNFMCEKEDIDFSPANRLSIFERERLQFVTTATGGAQKLAPLKFRVYIIGGYCILGHGLAIEIGRWLIISIIRDRILCHFCSSNVVKNETHFVMQCPLYTPIKDRYLSLFLNDILRAISNLSTNLDHQTESSLYLTHATALCYFRELASLSQS